MKHQSARERLIVALDVPSAAEAQAVVDALGDSVGFYKVGMELFFATHFSFIDALNEQKKRVFLDLKMDDIGTTLERALRVISQKPVDFLELATLDSVSSAVGMAKRGTLKKQLKLLMLTALSSLDDEGIQELYGPNASVDQIVDHRAKKALEAGCHGLIASGSSVRRIRGQFGDEPLIVTPGIRPQGSSANDHKRTLTPFEAIRDGANFLVVGRPIRDADDPKGVAEYIVKEIERGQAERDRLMKSHRSHREDFNALLNVAVGGH